jgi:hypothetical protein
VRHVILDPTKHTFIDAFFKYHRRRAERLIEVWEQGHQDDALTLCCCYLDGLASMAYPTSDRSLFNFVTLLREHGQQIELSLCSPLALVRWMRKQSGWREKAAGKLETAFGPGITKLVTEADLAVSVQAHLSRQDAQRMLPELWRASVAYIAYERLRNPFVHQLGGPGAVIVVNETVSEREVSIDFSVLHGALLNAMDHYESVSRTTGNWFGHDFKP